MQQQSIQYSATPESRLSSPAAASILFSSVSLSRVPPRDVASPPLSRGTIVAVSLGTFKLVYASHVSLIGIFLSKYCNVTVSHSHKFGEELASAAANLLLQKNSTYAYSYKVLVQYVLYWYIALVVRTKKKVYSRNPGWSREKKACGKIIPVLFLFRQRAR